MKNLEVRKMEFKNLIWNQIGKSLKDYTKEMLSEFFDYWTEKSIMGKKMRFEKEKVFCVNRRLRTWKSKSLIWNKTPEYEEKFGLCRCHGHSVCRDHWRR